MPKPTASCFGETAPRSAGSVGSKARGGSAVGGSPRAAASGAATGCGDLPLVGTAMRSVSSLMPGLLQRRQGDRLDDLGVAGAAAQVAGDRLADRVVVGAAAGIEVGAAGHQHPRRADPALRAAGLEERGLERVEGVGRGRQPLDRARSSRPRPGRSGRGTSRRARRRAARCRRRIRPRRSPPWCRSGRAPRAGRRAGGASPGRRPRPASR